MIEDCCHTFGGKAGGKLVGTFGVAVFFGSQRNKPFSTGLGGFALVRDDAVGEQVREQQERFAGRVGNRPVNPTFTPGPSGRPGLVPPAAPARVLAGAG